ncbi:hypothetical protein AM493_06740 [Flavobacterium akiainvivens]|uniref:DUF6597 domain-containing protein n=1 Tax=Flavobacterium akiainvivens TaxID=1202724 RepID=A0A0M9VHN7_9FLAO|nr:DUF6597 domain-containing transcriptional factor [Flavobacterium akiainvivens]KOS05766.1 hypothetical protein AM493_06740 [Flavobacterium akiainvivens]SFQ77499.1 AraC-type DNA-binding protein [Flavobacterium akiainvivens]
MSNPVTFQKINAHKSINNFVSSFWLVENNSDQDYAVVVMPDASFDFVITKKKNEPLHCILMGINTTFSNAFIEADTRMMVINFKLLAAEYILKSSVADLLNGGQSLPDDFWNTEESDFNDFNLFAEKITEHIQLLSGKAIDPRKQKLSQLIYASSGEMTVKELSENAYWNSRQINRYFTQYFGLPLKKFCNILRFRSSFKQINEGNLFPELNYSDQPHFEREVKKLTGANLRTLFKNKNDRFIQVSLLGNL